MKIWLFLLIGLAINNANGIIDNWLFNFIQPSETIESCQNQRNSCDSAPCSMSLEAVEKCSSNCFNSHIDCLNNILAKNINENEKMIINREIIRITQAFNHRHSFGLHI